MKNITKLKKISGGAGYRSRYLSHAKRALYHLSYAPNLEITPLDWLNLNKGHLI